MNSPTYEWPVEPPTHAGVRLRAFENRDVPMVRDMATDPHIPKIGTLPYRATTSQALAFIARQRGRLAEGNGFSFCVADIRDDVALGGVGLWLGAIHAGRASAGWGVAPAARGHRIASQGVVAALKFAWTIPELHRIEAYIEPWNIASVRTAELAGFTREGLMRSHQEVGGQRVDMQLYAVLRPERHEPQPCAPHRER
ncbi:MAG: GNAT family protein [Ornithinimicrobium sp.]